MGKAKRSGQATIPADPVLALAIYWLRADVIHTLVHAPEDFRDFCLLSQQPILNEHSAAILLLHYIGGGIITSW